jgi:phage regulator Rha-like protein
MPLIPRYKGKRISKFKASLVYRVSSMTARAKQRNPVLKNHKKRRRKKEEKREKRKEKKRKKRKEKGEFVLDV